MTSTRSLVSTLALCSVFALSGCLVSFNDFPLGAGGAAPGFAGAGASGGGGSGATDNGGGGGDSIAGSSNGSAGDSSAQGGSVAGGSSGGAGNAGGNSAGAPAGGASVGGGGASGGAPAGGGGSGGTVGGPPPMDLMIDDFEDGNAQILPSAGRNGAWFAANDGSLYASQTPDTRGPINPSVLMPARTMSMRALHVTGYGYKTWGAYVGASFVGVDPKEAAYDVSSHQGIQFFAKLGRSQVFPGVRVTLRDYDTFVGCSDCGDNFGLDITLTTDFELIQVPFSSMKQRGWGKPQVASFDATKAYGVVFSWDANDSFDVWIDDLSFY